MEFANSTFSENRGPATRPIGTENGLANGIPVHFDETQPSPMSELSDSDLLELIYEQVASVFIGLAETKAELNKGLSQLSSRDDLLAAVHTRLAKHEDDLVTRNVIEPLTRRIASIHRSIARSIAAIRQDAESQNSAATGWLEKTLIALQIELENTVSPFGVEAFTHESEVFDRTCQEAIQKTHASEMGLVGMIANRVSPGFRVGERIVVREQVTVYSG